MSGQSADVILNGSGLFDANRLSAATLTRVLSHAYRDPRLSAEFVAQLSIGGVDGTLRSRLRNHRKRRVVRAKTGTLARVVALSGFVLRDGKASTSYVQRRLGIGYNRAASIIERMEEEGVIGPANHAGKREILVPTEDDKM